MNNMIKIKPFRQTAGLCGPASLKMVFDYYGVSVPEAQIAKAAGATRKKGVTPKGLVRAARKFGFRAVFKENGTFFDIRRFIRQGIPVIVDWFSEDEGHYSVVVGIDAKNIILIDPELGGRRKMPLKKFLRVWFDFPGDYIKNPKEIVLRAILAVTKK